MCAKIAISEKLAGLKEYRGARIFKEFWLANVERRADICVIFPDGCTEIHEVQLARTTVDSLEERTNDYLRAGASDIVWWFGGQADNQNNKVWAKGKLGGYGELSITEGRELIL
jgi:competence CoiA-like predicted nuclease